eukprot:jgi/Ulvmu1/2099/UM125_0002.1
MDSSEVAVHVPSSADGRTPHAVPPSSPPQPSPTFNVKPAAVVIVRTAEELQLAVEEGSRDIEIRAHLDMRSLKAAEPVSKMWIPRPPSHAAAQLELLPVPLAVRSIRGACENPDPVAALGLSDADLPVPRLLPLKPYQCLLLIQDSWLAISDGRLWVDNVYLRLGCKRIGGYAFIYSGPHDLLGCIVTDWVGSTPPLTVVKQFVAHVHNTILRNMQLRAEVVDVSLGSTVRLVNVSLADVEPGEGHIVSTGFRDHIADMGVSNPWLNFKYTVYPGEDYDYPFEDADVLLKPVLPSERSSFGEQYIVGDATRSDCRFVAVAADAILPGCSEKSRQWSRSACRPPRQCWTIHTTTPPRRVKRPHLLNGRVC